MKFHSEKMTLTTQRHDKLMLIVIELIDARIIHTNAFDLMSI